MARPPKMSRKVINLSLAGVAGLAGLASVVIIFVALFLGIWLDATLNQRGIFTVSFLIASVPVSLYTMLKIVLGSVGSIISPKPADNHKRSAPDVEEE